MIGDQLETDIAGALSCNIHCALIATGVAVVNSATSAASIRPTYWMPSLRDE
jgi:ribonucleotide monophosphatase NagD (HAD superfamily)